jgi:hypothetical protein
MGEFRRAEKSPRSKKITQSLRMAVPRSRTTTSRLLACGALLGHVAHGTHAIGVVGGGVIGTRRTRWRWTGARLARKRDQRGRTLARSDRFRGVTKVDDAGAAACGRVGIATSHTIQSQTKWQARLFERLRFSSDHAAKRAGGPPPGISTRLVLTIVRIVIHNST